MNEVEQILIAEDDELLAELLGHVLSQAGYEVLYARDGEQALELIEATRPTGIILDCMMPGINGFDVLREIKMNFKTAEIPVLMLSARGLEQDIIGGLTLGADEYVVKPFMPEELLARLKRILHPERSRKVG